MNILFVGKCSPLQTAKEILHKKQKNPGFQIIKFAYLVLSGLKENGANVSVISNVNAPTIGVSKEIENGIKFRYVPISKIPILCQLLNFLITFFYTLCWGIKNKTNSIIFCDIYDSNSATSGAVLAAKICNIPKCALITDMLSTTINTSTLNVNHTLFWRLFFKLRQKRMHKSLKQYDGFIFLTNNMNLIYNPLQRPYMVMEGCVDKHFIPSKNISKSSSKVIFYAGAIKAHYGLNELVQAFMTLSIPNIELHIYGDGNMVEKLKEYQQQDSRIKYFGVVSNEQIVEEEQKATLLVNPRLSHEEYVKYSFPSKTSEYMLSGTPLLTTKLCGIPEEYFPYLYTFEDETINGFAKKLSEILSLPDDCLTTKGKDAQRFILDYKNNIIQSKRIKDFFTQIINSK